jgi:hypothetical protein
MTFIEILPLVIVRAELALKAAGGYTKDITV